MPRNRIKRDQIFVGDYVKLSHNYLQNWKSERPSRIRELRQTVFLVVETARCYSWRHGIYGGGMLLTLKPFLGPLAKTEILYGRGDSSVELIEPKYVDELMADFLEEREFSSNGI